MAHFDWTGYDISMEDLQNLPATIDFTNYNFDIESSNTPSLPPPSDFQPATTTTPTSGSSASNGITCTNNACGCGLSFRRRSDLKKHVDQRTRPYPCLHAGCTIRSFSTKHDRDRHQREVHGGSGSGSAVAHSTTLYCPVVSCKRHLRGFARKENLALHVRNMHPNGTQQYQVPAKRCDLSSGSASPAAATQPLSPAETQATMVSSASSSASGSTTGVAATSDAILLAGLNDRLATLHARRETLARQLANVDETIEAVSRTVLGLQGTGPGTQEPVLDMDEWENWDFLNGHMF